MVAGRETEPDQQQATAPSARGDKERLEAHQYCRGTLEQAEASEACRSRPEAEREEISELVSQQQESRMCSAMIGNLQGGQGPTERIAPSQKLSAAYRQV